MSPPPPSSSSTVQQQQQTPFDAFNARLQAAQAAIQSPAYIQVKSLTQRNDASAYARLQSGGQAALTHDDVENNYKVILMTQRRDDMYESMAKLVLGEQYGMGFSMHTSSFSLEMESQFEDAIRMATRATDLATRFDTLLGFTLAARDHNHWMEDWEGEEDEGPPFQAGVAQLGRMWNTLLRETDENLGVLSADTFTRQGVTCMLREFKEAVEDGGEGMVTFPAFGNATGAGGYSTIYGPNGNYVRIYPMQGSAGDITGAEIR